MPGEARGAKGPFFLSRNVLCSADFPGRQFPSTHTYTIRDLFFVEMLTGEGDGIITLVMVEGWYLQQVKKKKVVFEES